MKKKRGGQMKYNEKTIMISFRFPESKQQELKQLIKQKLKSYEKSNE